MSKSLFFWYYQYWNIDCNTNRFPPVSSQTQRQAALPADFLWMKHFQLPPHLEVIQYISTYTKPDAIIWYFKISLPHWRSLARFKLSHISKKPWLMLLCSVLKKTFNLGPTESLQTSKCVKEKKRHFCIMGFLRRADSAFQLEIWNTGNVLVHSKYLTLTQQESPPP